MRLRQKELRQRRHRKEQRIKAGNKGPAITGTGAVRPAASSRPASPARSGGQTRPAAGAGGGNARPNRPARTEG